MSLPRTGKLDQIIFKGPSQPKAVCSSKVCIQNLQSACTGHACLQPLGWRQPLESPPCWAFLLLQLLLHPRSSELQEGAAIAGGKESLG